MVLFIIIMMLVLNVEKFNKMSNLGINAEDMLGMIKDRFKNEKIDKGRY